MKSEKAYPQDLHIHTTYSHGDSSVAAEQTVDLVAAIAHAEIMGISDHFEFVATDAFTAYENDLRRNGMKVGVEVDGHAWVGDAASSPVDYYIFHCRDHREDYRSVDILLQTGKPVIIAHPNALATRLERLPPECLIEINNRYVWRNDWYAFYQPFIECFRFVISSDAHQPNWLGQSAARYAARILGVTEHLVFPEVQG